MVNETHTLKSNRSEINFIENRLNEINENIGIDMVRFLNFQIAVSEALVNAIVHGNKESSDKKVQVKITENDNSLNIEIIDEGEGFNPETLPDPTDQENLLKESGRGIFIIKSLVDYYSLLNTGSGMRIELRINKKADFGESALEFR
ncbi:ATP-binding protein [Ignavibacteria bacterium CHB1]|nr:MAG: ATP-binding protein [Chlorobiota bacterium]MBV6399111.1 Anti-sigma F factor [Ignavibacteria bacterium]MCC6885329.1 ATP-binding protein [Ignavibacteriales bacterium]MCE7953268.1 ATP-binding protein [Chlorobi bacterium CHB7]MDL1887314.1 ATP-binding protein [Ignavibacteria bacterium CHB1]RIK48384.1 MAG: ATP-binding protein [Ignavibacteriota bacterium]